MKPIIGITTLYEPRNDNIVSSINYNYPMSVNIGGATPILIPAMDKEEDIDNYINTIDALVLSGGEDVEPLRYGENPIKEIKYTSPERDEYEIKLYLKALEKDMPVLGICRGIQLMNIGSGGTLYQDINVQIENCLGHFPTNNPYRNYCHTVNIDKDSRLYNIFGKEELKVNSFHHQAVKKLADNFKVTAKSSEGIIEGIEHIDKKFVIGVQWHPEGLTINHPHFISLFEALSKAALEYRENK